MAKVFESAPQGMDSAGTPDERPQDMLPLAQATSLGYHTMPRVAERADERSVPAVLIIDDDRAIAELLREVFLSAGYRAYAVHDGFTGYYLAQRLRPAIVLTDWLMPDFTGYDLMRELERSPATRRIPVILMSSQRPESNVIRNLRFIPKPFDLDDVVSIVEACIRERATRDVH